MKKLNRKEWIAVAAGLGFITYIFFAGPLMSLFNLPMNTANQNVNQGLSIKDVSVGTGTVAEAGDIVTAHYVGKLADGRVFDSSLDRGQPISFTLGTGQVIKGWDEGLQGMKVGGTRELTLSPDYAYGAQAVGAIPPNSTLTFEVQLLDVKKKQ